MTLPRGTVALAAIGLAVLGAGCSSGATNDASPTITVAAAASLTDVFTTIGEDFTSSTDIPVRFTFAGSSAIAEQIRGGAPIDVFASAGTSSMTPLVEEQLVGGVIDFATNSLMIAVPPGNPGAVQSLMDLGGVSVVVCEEQVPCGVATAALIELNGVDISPVSLEPDVRSVLTKIETDEADAGIVYVTDVAASDGAVIGIAIPASANVSTTYQAGVTAESAAAAAAARFVAFLQQEQAQQLLADAGFAPPGATP
jgi:molybdate transport system substrate-binding protein